jgi:hypothetical protein
MNYTPLLILSFLIVITSTTYSQQTTVRPPAKVSSSKSKISSKNRVLKETATKQVTLVAKKLPSGKEVPSDFPKYVNTGNKEKDRAFHKAAKLKWRNENPERYSAVFRNKLTK